MGKAGGVGRPQPPARRRRAALGLRARSTIAFGLAGLLLSAGLSLVTYALARNFLIDQRNQVVLSSASRNAERIRASLQRPRVDLDSELRQLRTEASGFAAVYFNDRWFSQRVDAGTALPLSLRDEVVPTPGRAARQLFAAPDGDPMLAVGFNMPSVGASYFEVFPMDGTDRTLSLIAASLGVGTAVVTALAALVGFTASRRLFRPLRKVASAASELASGGLDARLTPESDPDLDRLITSFNDMADALQARIQREARFASDVSHELRSPITALAAAVEVLDKRRAEVPERSRQALDLVVAQVRRFDQMVLDLLEISRFDAGVAELHCEPVVLGDFVPRVAAANGYAAVPVDVSRPWEHVPVELDKRRIERVLANLLANADHHGGGPMRIAVDGRSRAVRIAVEDAGPGIADTEKQRIFERFARGRDARSRVGTGLGLALVSEHVALHGGRTWVEDRDGGGTRFVVELPVSAR